MSDFARLADLLVHHREAAPLASLMLPQGGVILVIGAYKGDTIRLLRGVYPGCLVYGYEPQVWAFAQCRDRFETDPNVLIKPYGLGTHNATLPLYEYGTDACSFIQIQNARVIETGEMHRADEELDHLGFDEIDLVVVNIEGGEYDLLPYLYEHDKLKTVRHWMIQWHHRAYYPAQSEDAYGLLAKTHVLTWYHDNWTMWVRLP